MGRVFGLCLVAVGVAAWVRPRAYANWTSRVNRGWFGWSEPSLVYWAGVAISLVTATVMIGLGAVLLIAGELGDQ